MRTPGQAFRSAQFFAEQTVEREAAPHRLSDHDGAEAGGGNEQQRYSNGQHRASSCLARPVDMPWTACG
jgi:hypothetical protein